MIHFPNNISAQAVIFDFDGVIVDTEPLHYKAFQRLLAPLGIDFSWDEYVETYMGFDDRDAFKEAHRRNNIPLGGDTLAAMVSEKAKLFLEIIGSGVAPYPGVVELIKKLRESGTPLAICSGALLSDIKPILEMLGISDCFDCIITADDVQQSKPDPACYILAFHQLAQMPGKPSLQPGTCIAIEDTPAGIASAKDADLQVIAVTNSYPRESLSAADDIVTSLELLLGFTTA